jgi:hypothetical protein
MPSPMHRRRCCQEFCERVPRRGTQCPARSPPALDDRLAGAPSPAPGGSEVVLLARMATWPGTASRFGSDPGERAGTERSASTQHAAGRRSA